MIDTILAAQEADGYLRLYRKACRITRAWDVYEQVYMLFVLVTDWQFFQERLSLQAATRLGDHLVQRLRAMLASRQETAQHA